MKVLKFGGSTLSNTEQIGQVLRYLERTMQSSPGPVLVISAFGGVTDALIRLSHMAAGSDSGYQVHLDMLVKQHMSVIKTYIPGPVQKETASDVEKMLNALKDTIHGVYLVKELSPKTLDFILSFGERLSAAIINGCLKVRNLETEMIDAEDLIITDGQFGFARVHWDSSFRNIRKRLKSPKKIPVIPGCIGSTVQHETTTFGRGGSDYTATLVAAALRAESVEIWTHVDGIHTADPNKVAKAFPIDRLSWDEAMELSHFGTKLIFPAAMIPAAMHDIPIIIRNIGNPDFQGTLIGKTSRYEYPVRGISSVDRIAMLQVQGSGMIGVVGIANRLFGALARNNINVILITQASSEHSICFAVAPEQAQNSKKAIEEEFALEISDGRMDEAAIENDASIVAVVGENMKRTPNIASRMFQALGKNGVNVMAIAQGSSELNISVVISRQDEAKALNALHEAFFLSDTKSLHVFLIGTGLIGSTLLKQMKEQKSTLCSQNALDIRLMGVGDIDRMVFKTEPIDPSGWKKKLHSGKPMDLGIYIDTMLAMNLPNTVFVDCTGSPSTVEHYERILDASVSIVTPNKIANSGPYEQYRILRNKAGQKGVKFLYETNVGAGLPVISTLNDLICAGDRIVKIEAILSGTLSYIFNSFSGQKKFSEIVKEARNRGLSEPDPRDDLNGLDVARKILILSRETGLPLEPEQVQVENILPEPCRKAKSVEAFLDELEKADGQFSKRRDEAAAKDQVLRYIATLENGRASVCLKGVDRSHPFFALSGSDNMIVFTTERYQELPLVIKGPGAGAEVTAAGVFADIIRIANYLS
ncbi:bifunctional aspartate kinase/homoserine dehydrogenase I [bacterium]|nr:bifunctional aspartate kinase/homoserine dehydrogenase I [bacterium]